jgi:hypothetical protein
MAGLYNFKGDRKKAVEVLKKLVKKHPANKRAIEILKNMEKDLAVK